jgi:hypothetical protein
MLNKKAGRVHKLTSLLNGNFIQFDAGDKFEVGG